MLIAHSKNIVDKEQTLEEHSKNVAMLMTQLLKPIELSKIGYLIGLLHDLGKASNEWQTGLDNNTKLPPHACYGRILYSSFFNTCNNDFKYAASHVIRAHHSHIEDDVSFNEDSNNSYDILMNETDYETDEKLLCYFLQEIHVSVNEFKELIQEAETEYLNTTESIRTRSNIIASNGKSDYDEDTIFWFEHSLLEQLLLSCLMNADQTDTAAHHDNIALSNETILPKWDAISSSLEEYVSRFKIKQPIDKMRREISLACSTAANESDGEGTKRLSVFCGGGKTLASMRYAINVAYKNNKKHIFMIIPFTSIIEQNADVLRNAVQTAEEELGQEIILEHHSNVANDVAKNANKDDLIKLSQESRRSGIHYDDYPIILTTQVQFLNAPFSNIRKSNKLMCQYIDSVVILDEFQALPTECLDLFYLYVDFLSNTMKSETILCSATQMESLNIPVETNLLTGIDWDRKYSPTLKRCSIIDMSTQGGSNNIIKDEQGIVSLTEKHVSNNQSVLIICNTKKTTASLFRQLKNHLPSADVFHLSTNMYPVHRRATLKDVHEKLQNGTRPVVLVATTIVEAGVDLSFDAVIRHIAGLDHIQQAAGRCNRNGEKSQLGTVYIVSEEKTTRGQYKQVDAAGQVLINQASNTELTADAIDDYYRIYQEKINRNKKVTSYLFPTESGEKSFVELFGDNYPWKSLYGNKRNSFLAKLSNSGNDISHAAMIRTCQDNFQVIKSNTIDIVIANNTEVEQLVENFKAAKTFKAVAQIQRELQMFSISIYENVLKDFSGYIETVENPQLGECLFCIFADGVYNQDVGLTVPENDFFIL